MRAPIRRSRRDGKAICPSGPGVRLCRAMEGEALTTFIEEIGRIVDFVGITITAGGGAASLAIYLWR